MCTNNSKWQFFIQRDMKRTSFCICSVCVRARVCVWLRGGETLSVSIAVLRLLSLLSVFYINSCTSSTQPWSWSHPSHSLLSLSFTVKHLEIIPRFELKAKAQIHKAIARRLHLNVPVCGDTNSVSYPHGGCKRVMRREMRRDAGSGDATTGSFQLSWNESCGKWPPLPVEMMPHVSSICQRKTNVFIY